MTSLNILSLGTYHSKLNSVCFVAISEQLLITHAPMHKHTYTVLKMMISYAYTYPRVSVNLNSVESLPFSFFCLAPIHILLHGVASRYHLIPTVEIQKSITLYSVNSFLKLNSFQDGDQKQNHFSH